MFVIERETEFGRFSSAFTFVSAATKEPSSSMDDSHELVTDSAANQTLAFVCLESTRSTGMFIKV